MNYTCPVCGHKTSRDLLVFLNHTNQHILDKIKEKNPPWVDSDGVCEKCLDHLNENLRGKSSAGQTR